MERSLRNSIGWMSLSGDYTQNPPPGPGCECKRDFSPTTLRVTVFSVQRSGLHCDFVAMVATGFPCQPRGGETMALAGAFLLGEGGAPAVLLFRIPHSRLHQLRVNECNRDVSTIIGRVNAYSVKSRSEV